MRSQKVELIDMYKFQSNYVLYLEVTPLPHYVTSIILERIKVMMEDGKIHPQHHVCDMTVELAAGAPLKEALEEMVRRNERSETHSIYQELFPQTKQY